MAAGDLLHGSRDRVSFGTEWLRPEDLALQEEDAEVNAEQAKRNADMRDMLKRKREERKLEKIAAAPEAFMEVKELARQSRRVLNEDKPPWFVARTYIDNAVLRLHEEILDFVEFMSHTPEEVAARKNWVLTISTACKTLWPDCQVSVFGSFYSGLSLPNGDVDIAVWDIPCKGTTAMKMLADYLLSKGELSWLEIIETAKVPVLKVRSQKCGLRADVVFNQPDGLETSKFIRKRLKEYPAMKPLLILLKYFLLQRGLHETYTGGMGSYLLCNVVLHFFQRHPALRDKRRFSVTSLGHLLFDFLKYYGQEFNYNRDCISVTDGGSTSPKNQNGWPQNNRRGGGLSLSLLSPLMPSLDLGAACFRMPVLRNLFHHGFHCICHLLVSRSPPEVSMLCPLLIDPAHPVITDRFRLMNEQPMALPGLGRSSAPAGEETAAAAAAAAEEEQLPQKKSRREAEPVASVEEEKPRQKKSRRGKKPAAGMEDIAEKQVKDVYDL